MERTGGTGDPSATPVEGRRIGALTLRRFIDAGEFRSVSQNVVMNVGVLEEMGFFGKDYRTAPVLSSEGPHGIHVAPGHDHGELVRRAPE